jgi:branched-chain amino acid transport system ATP-binding protein
MTAEPLLGIEGLAAFYGDLQVLHDISLEVLPGEIVAIVGANAAGKSTLLRALSGIVQWTGRIMFNRRDLGTIPPHEIVELGLIHVPEGRELFPFMTVEENLEVGAYSARARPHVAASKVKAFELLPRLKERRTQLASTMSGGEQQMCAIGRGMMARPEMLLLDEPSLGLAPVIIQTVYQKLVDINAAGTTILLVEQNLKAALRLARRAYVIENGRIVLAGSSQELLADPRLTSAYLGR